MIYRVPHEAELRRLQALADYTLALQALAKYTLALQVLVEQALTLQALVEQAPEDEREPLSEM